MLARFFFFPCSGSRCSLFCSLSKSFHFLGSEMVLHFIRDAEQSLGRHFWSEVAKQLTKTAAAAGVLGDILQKGQVAP
jgi:hypothetical protein